MDSSKKLTSRVTSVPPSGIRRFFEIAATMKDVITLGIGEPDFVSPAPIIAAAKRSMDEGKTGYTSNAGIGELRDAISDEINRLYDVRFDPGSEILVTVGVSEAVQLAMLALLEEGDEILIPEPCFVSYGPTAIFAGATVSYVPTSVETDFQVTAADIEARITPRSKMLLLSYPSNPTGAVLRRNTLEEIAELVVERDLMVLSDEI